MSEQGMKAEEVLKRVQEENETVLNELQKNGKVDESLKLTLLKEIDPANDKLFGLEIGEILENVDLAKGSEEFRNKDISSAYRHSGIKYVYKRIKHYLIDSGITENVFVEYSLLPSTLDPRSTGKLQCMSFIVGGRDFKEEVSNHYKDCIDKTREENSDISLYDHPDFLYNIPIDLKETAQTLTSEDGASFFDNGRGLRITRFRADQFEDECKIEIKSKSEYTNFKDEDEGKEISIGAFDLSRSFDEMLLTAKKKAEEKDCPSLDDIHKTLHHYCHTNISKRNEESHQSIYVSFPIFGARAANQLTRYKIGDGGNTALQGIGACFIYFEPNEFPQAESIEESVRTRVLDRIIGKITYEICNFIRFASANYLLNLGLQLQDQARKEALKSAVSAIMSRNMSHNLGSHYMYYTKSYLERLADSVDNIAPDVRGAAKVLGYIQARMDFLATLISNDKYPYGAVNFKSQIYDELTIDDFSHRHFYKEKDIPRRITNFLLKNIILSENFTRPDVTSEKEILDKSDQLYLYVKLLDSDNRYESFTGTWHSWAWAKKIEKERESNNKITKGNANNEEGERIKIITMRDEEQIKNKLSTLDIALPGGSMSAHALYNVIENFIRNSAKYLQNDINKTQGLVFTLALAPSKLNNRCVDIIIYDNKNNANIIVDKENELSLYEQIIKKLSGLVIIDEQNRISKDNKGFKEMLFSSIWMRSYMFGAEKTYADVVSEINYADKGLDKIKLIEKYGFTLVRVEEDGDGHVKIFERDEQGAKNCNLGLRITLPLYKHCDEVSLTGDRKQDVNNVLNTMADIVEVDSSFLNSDYKHAFTRPLLKCLSAKMTLYEKYHKVIANRFPDIDKYALSLDAEEIDYEKTPEDHCIYFHRHLSTQGDANPDAYKNYAYADSVSGGNFTITLMDLFRKGCVNGLYKTDDDKIFALKIKESALTRITIIDERLYNSTNQQDYPWQSLKNIRILNYDDTINKVEKINILKENFISNVFKGNKFRDDLDSTHFLSIHLGLIEKILQNSDLTNELINTQIGSSKGAYTLMPKRVSAFMLLLRDLFKPKDDSCKIYIAVHSGRGNYSAELEGPLRKYPFISLSALENAYNNSKYQLSQLFYNTVYLGKGFANSKQIER